MDIPVKFAPDGRVAHALDMRMRQQLAASLRHIAEQADGTGALPDGFAAAIEGIEGPGPIDPLAFAAYFRATEALLADDVEQARPHFDFLVESVRPAGDLAPVAWTGSSPLGTLFDYYERCFDTDRNRRFAIKAVSPENFDNGAENVRAGLDLLRRGAPEFAGEVEGLVHQLVLVENASSDPEQGFGGGSSYQLWGALALNVGEERPPLTMAETLAHEATHSFLFGHTIDEPLVYNPDDQLYKSPLRTDPRPMDGIYHATFVAARIHHLMDTLAAWDGLDGEDRELAEAARDLAAEKFRAGLSVVDEFGELSPIGTALMQAAAARVAAG